MLQKIVHSSFEFDYYLHAPQSSKVVNGKSLSLYPCSGVEFTTALENVKHIKNQLHIQNYSWFAPRQVHSDQIFDFISDSSKISFDPQGSSVWRVDCDAIITQGKHKVVSVSTADCLGILCVDTHHEILAAIHAGWRGAHLKLLTKTLNYLEKVHKVDISMMQFYISPNASASFYEVKSDVAGLFPEECVQENRSDNQKFFLDVRKSILLEFQLLGVPDTCLLDDNRCTISDIHLESFRRDGDASGRMTAFTFLS